MFPASDVANFLACHHLLTLDRAKAAGQIEKPYFYDLGVELLRELGARHEQAYLCHLTVDQGLDVAIIPTNVSWAEGTARTMDALRRGASAIYQATFQNGPWHGRSDFLIRVPKPSQLGAWSYEPLETKLARSTEAGALVQLCFYADLLSQIQGVQPEWVHTVLGSGTEPEKYHLEQYIAYFRRVKRDFETAYRQEPNSYPEPSNIVTCVRGSHSAISAATTMTTYHLCLERRATNAKSLLRTASVRLRVWRRLIWDPNRS